MEGNQMKMRDALVFCLRIIGANGIRGNVFLDDIQEAHKDITAALSAPPRQCDVGTVEEQTERMWNEYCRKYECLVCEYGVERHCPLYHSGIDCRLTWAQMPYEAEEGGAK